MQLKEEILDLLVLVTFQNKEILDLLVLVTFQNNVRPLHALF